MLAKIKQNEIITYPYATDQLQEDNPYTNFDPSKTVSECFIGTEANLAGYELVEVTEDLEIPSHNERNQKVVYSQTPVKVGSNWVIKYNVVAKTAQEIQDYIDLTTNNVIHTMESLLRMSDWTHITDYTVAPLTDAKKAEWAAYRVALRGINNQAGFPFDIVYPEKPE
jgi:hypothetical protein